MGRWRLLLLGLLGVLVAAFFLFDLGHYLSLETLKARQAGLDAAVAARPWLAAGLYVLLYVAVTALSLPGATLLTLIGGALFGLLGGTLLAAHQVHRIEVQQQGRSAAFERRLWVRDGFSSADAYESEHNLYSL